MFFHMIDNLETMSFQFIGSFNFGKLQKKEIVTGNACMRNMRETDEKLDIGCVVPSDKFADYVSTRKTTVFANNKPA